MNETLPYLLEYLYDVATGICGYYTASIRKHLLIITMCVFPFWADQYFLE